MAANKEFIVNKKKGLADRLREATGQPERSIWDELEKLRIILLANFLGHGAAFIIFLASKLSGAGDATMWLAIGYTLLATLLFGYFLDRPQMQPKHA